MPTVTSLLRKRLLANIPDRIPDINSLRKSQRSPEFETLCTNRKIIGAMRYGLLGEEDKPKYDRINDMIRRLNEYKIDMNKEHLVDVANLAECEFVEGEGKLVSCDDKEHTKEL